MEFVRRNLLTGSFMESLLECLLWVAYTLHTHPASFAKTIREAKLPLPYPPFTEQDPDALAHQVPEETQIAVIPFEMLLSNRFLNLFTGQLMALFVNVPELLVGPSVTTGSKGGETAHHNLMEVLPNFFDAKRGGLPCMQRARAYSRCGRLV